MTAREYRDSIVAASVDALEVNGFGALLPDVQATRKALHAEAVAAHDARRQKGETRIATPWYLDGEQRPSSHTPTSSREAVKIRYGARSISAKKPIRAR